MAFESTIRLKAVNRTSGVINGVSRDMGRLTNQMGRSNGFLVRNRRAFQQLGFQVGDFATQIAGGQSAVLAFTQQGSQMLQFFGPLGAVLAGLVAVFGSIALAVTKSGVSLEATAGYLGSLEAPARSLGSALGGLLTTMKSFGMTMLENSDVILFAIGIFVTWKVLMPLLIKLNAGFTASLVANSAAMQAAGIFTTQTTVAYRMFATAVYTVRGAFLAVIKVMRAFLVLGLILVLAKMVSVMLKLKQATGSWGEAFKMVGALISEVGDRIRLGWAGLRAYALYVAGSIRNAFAEAFNGILNAYDGFINRGREFGANILSFFEPDKSIEEHRAALGRFTSDMVDVNEITSEMRANLQVANDSFQNAGAPLESWQAIKEVIGDTSVELGGVTEAAEGAGGGVEDVVDKVKSFADSVKEVTKNGIINVFEALIDKSKDAGKALRELGLQLAKMAAMQAFKALFTKIAPGIFGDGGFLSFNADGNAFNKGNVTAFATGGVVNGPTTFPMSGGTGLMGEAGPEAIMPLTRIGGKLGVRSAGNTTNIEIINNTKADVRHETTRGGNGEEMHRFIVSSVGRGTARGELDGANSARYGQRPSKVAR